MEHFAKSLLVQPRLMICIQLKNIVLIVDGQMARYGT